VLDWDFDQPIIGANGMTFISRQLYNLFNNSDDLVEFKLVFPDGNFSNFAEMLEITMNNVSKNKKEKKYVDQDIDFIRNLTTRANTILTDPTDPTKLVISRD